MVYNRKRWRAEGLTTLSPVTVRDPLHHTVKKLFPTISLGIKLDFARMGGVGKCKIRGIWGRKMANLENLSQNLP